jgi:sugar-specific transcriptional regulator TrmB
MTPDINERLDRIEKLLNKQIEDQSKFNEHLETYQKASDRVANLAFTVVTASAAVVVLAPAVKVLAEFFASTMSK